VVLGHVPMRQASGGDGEACLGGHTEHLGMIFFLSLTRYTHTFVYMVYGHFYQI
jgi:hypothetical protein